MRKNKYLLIYKTIDFSNIDFSSLYFYDLNIKNESFNDTFRPKRKSFEGVEYISKISSECFWSYFWTDNDMSYAKRYK